MAGLLDFLQAASNAAASNVSGPVDGINWLLKKVGVPVSDAPVGGSQWMQNKGLTRPVQQGAAQVAGETVGLLSPFMAAQYAPQIAKGLLQAGENMAAPAKLNPQRGAIVWHGSPHKFDRFDSSKIGTGEGAQAYGHGLYLADDSKVAGSYQDKLSGSLPTEIAAGGKVLDFRSASAQAFGDEAADALIKSGAHMKPEAWNAVADTLRAKGLKDARPLSGNLYKVDLPDTAIAKMLDWDKPLSQQSDAVKNALGVADGYFTLPLTSGRKLYAHGQSMAGVDLHNELTSLMGEGTKSAASELLKSRGIPGIRYLDGGSRGAGAGTSNYVVFPGEEGLLSILERNGMPLR